MALKLTAKLNLKGRLAELKSAIGFKRPALPDVVLGLGVISLTVVAIGLLGVPGFHRLQLRVKAAEVIGNAATVQLAAETYAAAHGGRYARRVEDLLPYLPEHSAPENPYLAEPIHFRGGAGDLTYNVRAETGSYVIRAYAMGPGGRPKKVAVLRGP